MSWVDVGYIIRDSLSLGLPYALLALGIFISYRILDFADLSAEGSFTLGGAVCIASIVLGVNPYLATLLALISGFLAGIVTGVLHTKLKIPKLLSGIITMTGLFSINMVIMGMATKQSYNNVVYVGDNQTIFKTIQIFSKGYQNTIFLSLIIVLVFLALIYLFFGTEIGMSIRATGMNKKMARAQGINTSLMIIIGLAISNALIATGGSLYAQAELKADNNMGVGTLVIGLASIIIGEAIFGKRNFLNWIISVSIGSILYYLIITVAIQLGLPNYYKKLLYALLMVIILIVPLIKKVIVRNIKKGQVQHAND